MPSRNYWLDLFSGTTWQEFLAAGANVSGFRDSRWKTMQKIKPGDYLLCYLTGISRFVGALEVISEPFKDSAPVWSEYNFPCRLRVKVVAALTPETAVPIQDLRDELTIFQDLKNPNAWTGRLRGSPQQWNSTDGEAIVKALQEAEAHPVVRPVDPRKLERRPPALNTKTLGTVTVPDEADAEQGGPAQATVNEVSKHTEVQHMLLRLGRDMGFTVWAARNDRNREYQGRRFAEIFKLKDNLPLQFDEATSRTIELIDVLWLKGNAIVAAFEVESTTSIYSGLLRMSDLLAMQPNLNIPLYLVAPDERRDKVLIEVNRPTFSRLSPPLSVVCRYISFSTLQSRLKEVGAYLRYLKPEFLEELSEPCTIEDV